MYNLSEMDAFITGGSEGPTVPYAFYGGDGDEDPAVSDSQFWNSIGGGGYEGCDFTSDGGVDYTIVALGGLGWDDAEGGILDGMNPTVVDETGGGLESFIGGDVESAPFGPGVTEENDDDDLDEPDEPDEPDELANGRGEKVGSSSSDSSSSSDAEEAEGGLAGFIDGGGFAKLRAVKEALMHNQIKTGVPKKKVRFHKPKRGLDTRV